MPMPAIEPYATIARVRRGPAGTSVVIRDKVVGVASAAPSPCPARAARSTPGPCASPATADETVNSAIPAIRVRRWPSRSPIRPPTSSSPA